MHPRRLPQEQVRQLANPQAVQYVNVAGGLPAKFRRRVKESVEGRPILTQAWQAKKAGKRDQALSLFRDCLAVDEETLKLPQFFGAFWGLADILREQGKSAEALRTYLEAVQRYPDAARESHFLTIAEVISTVSGERGEALRDAVLERGLVVLREGRKPCEQLERRILTLDQSRGSGIGEGRVLIREHAFVGAHGMSAEVWNALGTKAQDWIEKLDQPAQKPT